MIKYPLTTESAMKKIEDNNTLVSRVSPHELWPREVFYIGCSKWRLGPAQLAASRILAEVHSRTWHGRMEQSWVERSGAGADSMAEEAAAQSAAHFRCVAARAEGSGQQRAGA